MELKKILELMKNKYPGNTALLIYDDESGRITDDPMFPYDNKPLFSFHTVDQLISHLQEN